MERTVQAELLDGLPSNDPRATGSRRDLRRINALMGNARLTATAMARATRNGPPSRLVDLGAGDAHWLLQVTRRLPMLPRGMEILLVDRGSATDERVLNAFQTRGFVPRVEQAEVMEWLRATPAQPGTWMAANLFLHHFQDAHLRTLFDLIAGKSSLFCACEPERSTLALTASRLVGVIGANAVTRHDAVVSVRAGFTAAELSALWPQPGGWQLGEQRAGLFGHLFLAERT